MAIYKRDIVDINLETGNIHRSFLKHSIGYLDQQADRFGIRTYRDGAPVDLSGVSVQGIFMPPQGSPISITGVQYTSVIGNEAIVVLPQACYNYDGQFTLAIKLVDSTNAITGTMRIIDGMVDNTHASGTVAPTSAVPTYQEILATYDAMVAATAATNASLANYYSDLPSRIPAGTYCIYNHVLYRCIATIATKGEWDSSYWTPVKLGNDVHDLRSDVNDSLAGYYSDLPSSIPVGTYCIYNNILYRCISPIASKGAWDATKWEAAKLANDTAGIANKVSDLKSAFNLSTWADANYIDMSQVNTTEGQYIKPNGDIATHSAFAYTDYIEIPDSVSSVTVNRGIHVGDTIYPQDYMVWWYDANKTLLGVGTQQIKVGSLLTSVKTTFWKARYIRVNLSRNHVNPFVWLGYEPELRYNGYYEGNIDIHTITKPGYYAITASVGATNMPKALPGLLTVKKASWEGYYEHTFVCDDGVYVEYKQNNTTGWTNWFEIIDRTKLTSAIENRFGKVGSFTGAFTQTETIIAYNIILKKNTSYLIRFNNTRDGLINIYGHQNANNFKRVYAWMNEVVFTNDGTDRYLDFYNPLGQLDSIDVDVFAIGSIEEKAEKVTTVYTVTKDASTADYTSLSKCLIDLKDDHNPKVIEIWEGDYDIYAEYQELYTAGLLEKYQGTDPSMDYFNYCVWVPENTHLIGKGIVRLKWEPSKAELEADEMTGYQTCCISPLNVAATATIENIEVYCKNGRYCLHNDGLGISQFTGAVQRFINCRFYKYPNDKDDANNTSYGFNHTTGFGIDRSQHHVYENCVFENYVQARAFYGHSRLATVTGNKQSPDITLVNCVIDAFKIHKCITAITTPAPWDSSKWENGIPDSSVTELEIHNMIANAKPWSAASTYDVGDTLYVVSSEYVKFGNSTTNTQNAQIRTMFNNCCVKGLIKSVKEGSGDPACKNAFDMQFLNSGEISVQITDSENKYPPKAYNTNLTIVD